MSKVDKMSIFYTFCYIIFKTSHTKLYFWLQFKERISRNLKHYRFVDKCHLGVKYPWWPNSPHTTVHLPYGGALARLSVSVVVLRHRRASRFPVYHSLMSGPEADGCRGYNQGPWEVHVAYFTCVYFHDEKDSQF